MVQTDKGHFKLTFENGYTVSVINGYGSYSENHFNRKLLSVPDFCSIDSEDCEIAIMHNGIFVTNSFVECDDSVKGYVTPEELADIIYRDKNKIIGSDSND